mgnify:CR=1 FL=1
MVEESKDSLQDDRSIVSRRSKKINHSMKDYMSPKCPVISSDCESDIKNTPSLHDIERALDQINSERNFLVNQLKLAQSN